MAQLISNTFASYLLSPEEEEMGQVLNYLQKAVLQNKLSQVASDKLVVTFDPTKPGEFTQNEAYLRGQLDVINWLLDTSEQVERDVRDRQLAGIDTNSNNHNT